MQVRQRMCKAITHNVLALLHILCSAAPSVRTVAAAAGVELVGGTEFARGTAAPATPKARDLEAALSALSGIRAGVRKCICLCQGNRGAGVSFDKGPGGTEPLKTLLEFAKEECDFLAATIASSERKCQQPSHDRGLVAAKSHSRGLTFSHVETHVLETAALCRQKFLKGLCVVFV
jgi:hypothetical protein